MVYVEEGEKLHNAISTGEVIVDPLKILTEQKKLVPFTNRARLL